MASDPDQPKGSSRPPAPLPRRVKTPTVLQMEAVECGAAALAIVLAYHGRLVPLEQLRSQCGVSRDGSKASNVVRAAREYGLDARGFKKEPADLKTIAPPFIVFWNFDHFLVVEGFKKGRVYLNDPAAGPRWVTEEEFDHSFTGVVLKMPPGPDFQPGGEKPSLIRSLTARLAGSRSGLLYVVAAGLFMLLPGLAIPTFTRVFIDEFLVKRTGDLVQPLLVGMGVTLLVFGVLVWLQNLYLLRLSTKIALSTSSHFFWHVLHLPIEFFTQRYGGEIGARVGINDRVASLLSGELASNVISLVVVVFYAALMFHYDPLLTVLGVCIAALNVLTLRFVSRKRIDGNRRLLQDEGKLIGTSLSGLQMIETLKATGAESDFFARWSGYQAKVINAQQHLAAYNRVLNTVPPLLFALNTAVILGWGGWRVMEGHLTPGMLIAFQMLFGTFIAPFNTIVSLGGSLQQAEGDMNRLDDVLRYQPDPQFDSANNRIEKSGPAKLAGHLELKNVTFGYSKLDPPLIENFNLVLQPGQRIALVGGSGSGKSTVAKLVCGLYQPWSGEILYDGQPRSAIPPHLLHNSLALVDQDIFLFAGSVRDNLTLWDETVQEDWVVEAAKDASIHGDIAARPGNYESPVREGGNNFSGGQRQRLEIARALVQHPSLLVLDEATSALDSITERVIDDSLRRRGCSCLLIAHRLSTIRDCDEIVVLQRGKVIQRGTHDEMKNVPGPYAQLIAAE